MSFTKDNIVFGTKPTIHNFRDLTGRQFGRLTVLGYAESRKKKAYWWTECACGTIKKIAGHGLLSGRTQSCNCLNIEHLLDAVTTHGETSGAVSPEYKAFHHAKDRCNNPNTRNFHRWGGRGIEFRFTSFEEFLADIGRRPSDKHSIDRIDNDGHYEIGNVRWATMKEQNRTRSTCHLLTWNGETRNIIEWSEHLGISHFTISNRLKYGWCIDCIFTQPFRGSCSHK